MDDQGTPVSAPSYPGGPGPTPPPPGAPAYTPPPPGAPAYATPPPRRSGGKVWIVIAAIAVLAILGACALIVIASLALETGTGASGGSVALIHLSGTIAGTSSGGGGETTPETFIKSLKNAEEDDGVKAILLRIDSPGGTVAASEEIATAVSRVKKPIVASIGDIGASGAYMVASQCDEIVASPTSSVGSIGVVMEVPNLEGLLGKAGVKVVVITKGKLKDVGSPFRQLTAEEQKLIDAEMTIAYDRFIEIVAKGRKLPEAKVREMATGWVWMAVEGKRMGLVDTLGNYTDAVKAAGKRGGISGEPRVVDFDEPELPGFLRALFTLSSRLPALGALDPTTLAPDTPAVPR